MHSVLLSGFSDSKATESLRALRCTEDTEGDRAPRGGHRGGTPSHGLNQALLVSLVWRGVAAWGYLDVFVSGGTFVSREYEG